MWLLCANIARLDIRETVKRLVECSSFFVVSICCWQLEIKIIVQQLMEDGFQVCVMHFRGLGGMELSNAKFGDCEPEGWRGKERKKRRGKEKFLNGNRFVLCAF